MLEKSRALSTLLLGLGIALVVGGLVAPRFLLGDGRLPLSINDVTWTISDPDGLRDGQPAPVVHQLHMEIRNPSDADTASVRVGTRCAPAPRKRILRTWSLPPPGRSRWIVARVRWPSRRMCNW
ncbi:DUF3068 domain-containing protein [Corynebacterium aquatimens]|nr:porin PorA family protein [Corynebacterium aquatimens]QYH20296.1 DUF3068 domain-containing protein [Corynebacterium aquatimens]